MTARVDKFETMTGAELAAEAAALMGWELCEAIEDPFDEAAFEKDGLFKAFAYEWGPSDNLSQAGEFGAAFLAAWPGCYFILSFAALGSSAQVFENFQPIAVSMAAHPSEATARTVAVCRAWTALKGEA